MIDLKYLNRLRGATGCESKQSPNGTLFVCQLPFLGEREYLHILFYPLNKKGMNELVQTIQKEKGYSLDKANEYTDFLQQNNGGIFFSGAFVLFGQTRSDRQSSLEEPSPILKNNLSDHVSSSLNRVLYIGNALHKDLDNINFYINLENGIVLGYHKGKIVRSWRSFGDFLSGMIMFYNSHYDDTGKNLHFKDPRMHVYENTQLYWED